MARYIDYNQTDGSTPVATLSRVGSVKPDGTSINISADGTINCNGKLDLDAGNLSTEGKHNVNTLSFPGSHYDNLTLGASGSQYTAPANGYLALFKFASGSTQYAQIRVGFSKSDFRSVPSGNQATPMLPLLKGETATVEYNLTGSTTFFRFIYAEGESNV